MNGLTNLNEVQPVRVGHVKNCMGCSDLGVNVPMAHAGYHCKVNMEDVDIRTKIITCGECPKGYYLKNPING